MSMVYFLEIFCIDQFKQIHSQRILTGCMKYVFRPTVKFSDPHLLVKDKDQIRCGFHNNVCLGTCVFIGTDQTHGCFCFSLIDCNRFFPAGHIATGSTVKFRGTVTLSDRLQYFFDLRFCRHFIYYLARHISTLQFLFWQCNIGRWCRKQGIVFNTHSCFKTKTTAFIHARAVDTPTGAQVQFYKTVIDITSFHTVQKFSTALNTADRQFFICSRCTTDIHCPDNTVCNRIKLVYHRILICKRTGLTMF